MVDATAERIATLGASPTGTPARWSQTRTWDDYSIGRGRAIAHLGALDLVYTGVIESHREAIDATRGDRPGHPGPADRPPAQLELFHWFVRAHLETPDGSLVTEGADSEKTRPRRPTRRARSTGRGGTELRLPRPSRTGQPERFAS